MRDGRFAVLAAVAVGGLAAAVVLIWTPTYVPLFDLPNHMARHYIESLQLAGRDPGGYYGVRYRVMPNLGADLVVPPLMLLFPPLIACKLFLTGSVLLFWGGQALFVRSRSGLEGRSWMAATALLTPWIMNGPFFWGFLNYYSGMGLAFLLLAHREAMRGRPRFRPLETAAHASAVGLLFIWHLFPWAIYVALTSADTLARVFSSGADWKAVARRQIAGEVAVVLPSLGLLLLYLLGQEHAVNPNSRFFWGGPVRKLTMWLVAFRGYDARADAVVLALWVAAILLAFDLRAVRRGLSLRSLAGPAVLAACYLVLPSELGSTTEADLRILPALLACSVGLLGQGTVRRCYLLAVLLAVAVGVRTGSVATSWARISARFDAEAKVFTALPRKARVLPVTGVFGNDKRYPEVHFGAWTVITSGADYPRLFTWEGGGSGVSRASSRYPTPLIIHDGGCPVPVRVERDRFTVVDGAVRRCYDYVLVLNPLGTPIEVPASFPVVARSGPATLYRVTGAGDPVSPDTANGP